jgi:adenylate kinase family enzyme
MSGLPFSGKSTIAKAIVDQLPYESSWINPKDYLPEDFNKLSPSEQGELNISAWAVSIELLEDQINNSDDRNIVIYDTACANREKMLPLFLKARRKHHVIFCFVKASVESCKARKDGEWFTNDVIDKYNRSFEENTPLLAKQANKVFLIENDGKVLTNVTKVVEYIAKYYERAI